MTDHLYREIEELRESKQRLSAALADMIDMYEKKKRNGIRLGNARAALTGWGVWPKKSSESEEASHG
jgi:hypothetical protein